MRSRRLLVVLLVTVPILSTLAACWYLSRPRDEEWVIQQIANMATKSAISEATHIPFVTPDRVDDGIYIQTNDVLEIGLFALDFEKEAIASQDARFEGKIVNYGDLEVTGITAWVVLFSSEGHVVDAQSFALPKTSLMPRESMRASLSYRSGVNPPRLLSESLVINSPIHFDTRGQYGFELNAKPELAWLAELFPDSEYETTWTEPSEPWTDWKIRISCKGEGFR